MTNTPNTTTTQHPSRQEQFPRREPRLCRESHSTQERHPHSQEPHSHHREQRGLVLLSWLLVVAVAAGIFLMSSRNAGELDHGTGIVSLIRTWLIQAATMLLGHPVDVSPLGHFSEFCLFGAALANALRWHLPAKFVLATSVLIGSLYGVSDEIHQLFVPGRSCDPADWLVDTIATAVGAAIVSACVIRQIKRKRRTHGQ